MICTPEHPIFVQNKGWVPAGMLNSGDFVITGNGGTLAVDSISWQRDEKHGFTVYNLTVEDDHTYFVGTVDGGVWVHNVPCTALVEFQIDDYGTFNSGVRRGDKYQGHEIIQNAWMKAHGYSAGHGLDPASKENPAIAVDKATHKILGRIQGQFGLNNPTTLANLSSKQIIDMNIDAMRWANAQGASIPEARILAIKASAEAYALKNKW